MAGKAGGEGYISNELSYGSANGRVKGQPFLHAALLIGRSIAAHVSPFVFDNGGGMIPDRRYAGTAQR